MDEIIDKLNKREEYLLCLKAEKEKALAKVPDGTLRVCDSGGKLQYYQRNDAKDTSGVYISKENIEIAGKLAQKDYDEKVLRAVEKELLAIRRYQANYPTVNIEHIYERLHRGRKALVVPIKETEEEFLNNWKEVKYLGKDFGANTPEFYTEKGERVRSKSEVIIADALFHRGIPYRYECPLYIQGIGRIYPDFTILNVRLRKEMYWEHFGMMDDLDYVDKAVKKINGYTQSGLFAGDKIIYTYETKANPLSMKQVSSVIQKYLM